MKKNKYIGFIQYPLHENVMAKIDDGTLWISIDGMAALFDNAPDPVLSSQDIILESDFHPERATLKEGFYNLDAVLCGGYTINPAKTIAFKMWAYELLKNYKLHVFMHGKPKNEPAEENPALRSPEEAKEIFDRMLSEIAKKKDN